MINSVLLYSVSSKNAANTQKLSGLSDEQLLSAAQRQVLTDKKTARKYKNTTAMIASVPIADSFAAAVPQKSSLFSSPILSAPLGAFTGRLASWMVAIGALNLISKGIDKVTEKSETLTKLKENNPFIKSALDLSVMAGGLTLGKNGIKKAVQAVPDKYKQNVLMKIKNIKNGIDSSKFAKNIYAPLAEKAGKFFAEHNKLALNIKKALPYVAPALVAASIIKTIADQVSLSNRINKQYVDLKTKRDFVEKITKEA